MRYPIRTAAGALLAVLALGACDTLDEALSVEAPSRVDARNLDGPESAKLLVDSSIADFACALGEYIVAAGLVGDEFIDANLASRDDDYERRTLAGGDDYATLTCGDESPGIYMPLATARWQADNALRKLETWSDAEVPDRGVLIGTAAAMAGYSYLLIGEGWCTAAFDEGPELGREDVLALAEERFTRALAAAAAVGDGRTETLARVGRARARLDLGRGEEAAADAALVPEGFAYELTYSNGAERARNPIFVRNVRDGRYSVGPVYRGMAFRGVPDPRVAVALADRASADPAVPLWVQGRYGGETASIPLATWEEARLIVAEVRGGAEAVAIINELHARVGLPPFEATDPAAIRAQLVYERRAELFAESHHLGDLIRFGLELTPAPGTPYRFGGVYGDQRCAPLPQIERLNNPNL